MLREVGMALLFFTASAAAASAEAWADGPSASAGGRAVQQTLAVTGKATPSLSARTRAVQLQIGGAVALAEPTVRAVVPIVRPVRESRRGSRQENGETRPAAPAAVDRGAIAWFDLGGSRPLVAYPVTTSLTLGLGYRYVKGEDLVLTTVDPGSLSPDYDSHNVLLRARWRF